MEGTRYISSMSISTPTAVLRSLEFPLKFANRLPVDMIKVAEL